MKFQYYNTSTSLDKRLCSDPLSAAAGAVGTLIGGIFSNGNNKRTNATNLQIARETNQANKELAQQQNDWNIEQWNRENEYNSASSQIQRLRDAGLNPLLYGDHLGSAQASQLTSADLANQQAAQMIPDTQTGNIIAQGLQNSVALYNESQKIENDKQRVKNETAELEAKLPQIDAEIHKTEAETLRTQEEVKLTTQKIAESKALQDHILTQRERDQFELEFRKSHAEEDFIADLNLKLSQYRLNEQKIKESINHCIAEMKQANSAAAMVEIARKNAHNTALLIKEEIKSSEVNRKKSHSDRRYTDKQTELANKEIENFEAKLIQSYLGPLALFAGSFGIGRALQPGPAKIKGFSSK